MAGLIEVIEELGPEVDALLDELCTDLCHAQAATLADDGDGGKAETWADTGDALSCVAFPGRGKLHGKGEVPAGKSPFTVIVRGDAAVTPRQRIRVHSTSRHAEQVVEVVDAAKHFGLITEVAGYVKL